MRAHEHLTVHNATLRGLPDSRSIGRVVLCARFWPELSTPLVSDVDVTPTRMAHSTRPKSPFGVFPFTELARPRPSHERSNQTEVGDAA